MGKIITVDFRADTLFAAERDDGVFVAITPICAALGLDAQKQRKRIQDDPILSEGACQVAYPSAGGMQETFSLRLDLVNGWLFSINEKLVRDEDVRQKVLTYKRECYAVLFQHFYGRVEKATAPQHVDVPHENEAHALRKVVECRHVFGHRAAAELWFKLGLDVVPSMLHDPRQLDLMDYTRIRPADDEAA